MKDIQIKQYEAFDQESVWNLHIDGLKQTNSYIENPEYDKDLKNIRKTYLNNHGEFFLAVHQNIIIGIGALRKVDDEIAEIKRMRINSKYQGKRIGGLMLDKLIETAKDFGYKN